MSHFKAISLFLALAPFCAGCPTRPTLETASHQDGAPDGTPGADGADGRTAIDAGPPSITIISPSGTTYTNAAVTLRAAIAGSISPSATITLTKNDVDFATLTSLQYAWDTTADPEGSYLITAHANVDGHSVSSAPVTVVVDRTPPTLQLTPAVNATNVAVSDPVTMVFSEPILPSTVPALTTAVGPTPVPTTTALSSDATTLTLSLALPNSLTYPSTFAVALPTGITDRAGNPLVPPPAWTWTAPFWVTYPSLPGGAPSLALDLTDHPLISTMDTTGLIRIDHYGGTSAADVTAIPSPASALFPPQLTGTAATSTAVDSTGALFFSWTEDHILLGRWDGAAWDKSYGSLENPTNVAPFGGTFLALDHHDRPVVAWNKPQQMASGSAYVTLFAGSPLAPAWPAIAVGPGGGFVRIDTHDNAVVLSCCSIGSPRATLSRSVAGSWVPIDTTTIAAGVQPAALAVDSMDRPWLVQQSSSFTQLLVRFFATNAWSAIPSPIPVTSLGEIRLALTTDDRSVVAWTDTDAQGLAIHVARLRSDSTWDFAFPPLDVSPAPSTTPRALSLSLDKSGRPVVAWEKSNAGAAVSYVVKSNY